MSKPYSYFAMALDPIHVGSGKMGLGRVDMSIMREAATNLPIIPGSSICGVTRAAVAINTGKYPGCVGKGGEDSTDSNKQDETGKNGDKNPAPQPHCGLPDCPVCVAFGFSKKNSSFQGLVSFYDARVLFFPVNTLVGTVWITSPDILKTANIANVSIDDKEVAVSLKVNEMLPDIGGNNYINLGWLRMPVKGTHAISVSDNRLSFLKNRIVLVSNTLFSHIINDNLETRTSVSIDPLTGAASDGALFSYEALPRSTVLFFQVGIAEPHFFSINSKKPDTAISPAAPKEKGKSNINFSIQDIKNHIDKGFESLQYLGIGGMNTRGMGRIVVCGYPPCGTIAVEVVTAESETDK